MIYAALRFWYERRQCNRATLYITKRRTGSGHMPPTRDSVERRVGLR